MRLKPELVRDLLLAVEEYLPFRGEEFEWPAYASEEEVDYHCIILIDAGLLKGTHSRALSGKYRVLVERLTPSGHDFLDAVRNESVFRQVQEQLNVRKVVSVPLDLMAQLAKRLLGRELGLE